jgi:hypothetical protein
LGIPYIYKWQQETSGTFFGLLIRLSPRWEGASPLGVLASIMLALVPLVLIFLLASYESRLVTPPTAVRLIGLRVFVLLLILFLVLCQPVVAWPQREKPREVVVIAVDRSGSMDVTDPQRPVAEKLKLALALQLGRDLTADSRLEEWIDQLGSGNGVRWVGDDEYAGNNERRGQLEQERRHQFDEICKRVDALTRSQTAKAVLADSGLVKELEGNFDVELLSFDRGMRTFKPRELTKLFEKSEDEHAGDFTNIALPLTQSLERDSKGGRVRAVILFTDGQHNPPPVAAADDDPGTVAQLLGKRAIPVFPIGLGVRPNPGEKPSAPPDVSVTLSRPPDCILKDLENAKNDNITLDAHVHVSELPPQDLRVELLLDGKVIDHKIIRHEGKDDYPVSFSTRLTREGVQRLTVRVKEVPGEGYTGNNERSALVKVVEDYCEVLLVDGEARWDYHYLAAALARDPMVKKLDRVVFQQPRLNEKLDDRELAKNGYPMRKLPPEADALAQYDCIVLGDVTPDQLPLADRKRLYDYVDKRGGTLVMVAGKRAMPLGYPAPKGSDEELDPMLKLLPITRPHAFNITDGFQLTLTDEGVKNPLLQMPGNPFLQTEAEVDKPRPLAEVEKHYWAVVGDKKPGATVLAYGAVPPLREPAQRLGQHDKQGLLVSQPVGSGKVIYVALDSTWRWRYKTGDQFHHYFWGQLVRWAASDKLLEGGGPQVRFGAAHAQYDPGDEVEVRLRMGDEASKRKLSEPRMKVLRKTDDGEEVVSVVTLKARDGQPRLLEGKIRGLAEGTYRLEPEAAELQEWLRDPADDKTPKPRPALFEISMPESKEMLNLAPDWDQMEELADAGHGKVYTAENAMDVVKALKNLQEKQEARPEIRLWEWWPVLAAVLLLLTLEWAGRKLAGLA